MAKPSFSVDIIELGYPVPFDHKRALPIGPALLLPFSPPARKVPDLAERTKQMTG